MEYGVVFGGGGSRGSYEIGVWKALLEMGIDIKAVAGTSVGALNGAMLVQGDFETAYDIWVNLNIQNIVKLENISLSEENRISIKDFITYLRCLLKDGGLDISPLRELLLKYIDEERIRKSKIDFGLVTFSLSDLKPVIVYKEQIPEGQLIDYLIASASLPVFKNQAIENKIFVDGGIYDNIPVSLIADKGIENIVVVDCSGIGRVRKIFFDGIKTIYIKNSRHLGGTLHFDSQIIKNNIDLGYLDALKAFGKLTGKRFFFSVQNKNDFLTTPLTQNSIDMLFSMLDIKKMRLPSDIIANYRILRTIKGYVNGELNAGNIVLAALEITAEVFGIDSLNTYNPDELANLIFKEYCELKESKFLSNPLSNIKSLIPDKVSDLRSADAKYLACIGVGSDESINMILYRKFLATTLPKICIANLFLSLMAVRMEESENMPGS
ncbi:MAG TPA: patatin-like phospholipase family protein [Clostridiaceae bacterium]|nr:patatin-like phospholipase family protein [Clostridiaceae bacterium]